MFLFVCLCLCVPVCVRVCVWLIVCDFVSGVYLIRAAAGACTTRASLFGLWDLFFHFLLQFKVFLLRDLSVSNALRFIRVLSELEICSYFAYSIYRTRKLAHRAEDISY